MKGFACISFMLFISLTASGQEKNIPDDIMRIAEELASDESEQESVSILIEQLHELEENRVAINRADEGEISRLFFLTGFQVKALCDHVKTRGYIESVYEIALITGFGRETAEMMLPFIDLSHNQSVSTAKIRPLNTMISNFIIKPGESDTTHLGSPFRFLARYRLNAGPYSGGFTTEKDAGEKMFDFFSGHLAYNGSGSVRKIILGDFACRWGEGINVNTGIRTGLSLTSSGYMSGRNDIRPWTSTGENNFFRGVAALLKLKNADLIIFLSHNLNDASLTSDFDSTEYYVGSLSAAGVHNTPSLLLKKDAVAETTFGTDLSYSFRRFRGGIGYSESRFSLDFDPGKSEPANLYDFEGNINRTLSAHYRALLERILLYGEISMNRLSDYAMVQGLTLRPSDRLTLNFMFRNYSPGYTAFHASGPGTSSSNNNEQGVMGNFRLEAGKHLFISAGCDLSRYPWLRYRCSYPSAAKRSEVKINYIPSEKLSLDLVYNSRYYMYDLNGEPGLPGIHEAVSHTFRTQLRYAVSDNLKMMTRIDYKYAADSRSYGMLMLQDLVCTFNRLPLTLWCRYCLFNTDNWDSRLYTYENDLLYSFSIPALSGKGSRSYLMVRWEFGDRAELRVRYSVSSLILPDNAVEENDELKLQARIWF